MRLTLNGHTQDLSEHGLGLVLPSVHLGGFYFTDYERKLRVMLDLPHVTVDLEVLPVRYHQLEDGAGYLVGVRIIAVSDADRAEYNSFLKALSDRKQRYAATLTPQVSKAAASLSVIPQ